MKMIFEWDDSKARINPEKHKISFDEASTIFSDPSLITFMKKTNKSQPDDILPEYNLEGKKGVRGKYARAMKQGYSVRVRNEDGSVTVRDFVSKENTVLLDPDVKAYFPDSESVNRALRSLIKLIPQKKAGGITENRGRYGRK
jgi:hypothetical protein